MDKNGHAHLTDFNVACHIEHGKALTSVAGTVYYMAPEIIYRKGYTFTTDWWSLGVMAFELLFGRRCAFLQLAVLVVVLTLCRPFRGKKSAEVMRGIMHDTPEIPENTAQLASAEAKDCILRVSAFERSPCASACC